MKTIRIATRESPLALWQAQHVAQLLRERHPGLEVAFVAMSTQGDRFLAASLSAVGGKGLFVKEIEQALIDGRAEIAVHSLKDMTARMPEGLLLAAVPEREDPRDAFIGRQAKRLDALPAGAVIGTSSLRRSCQLLAAHPALTVQAVRGNVQTRLRKIEEDQLAGAVLALAGLKRLGLESHVSQVLSVEESLPAVGQGVLAIQCRSDDASTRSLLAPLEHAPTRAAIRAERALMAALEGGCTVPLAGYAVIEADTLWLRALLGQPDGKRIVRGERRGTLAQGEELGRALADELLMEGGREILATFGHGGKA